MNILSLFDGISCGQLALDEAGVSYEKYFASEIDKFSIMVTQKNYPDTIQIGDVRNIDLARLPAIDMLIGGSPCQDLSIASQNGTGLDGEKSSLFYDFVRIKNELKPKYFLLENVVPRKKRWKDEMDEALGSHAFCINSDRFVPQNRTRLYWTNIPVEILPARPCWDETFFSYNSQRNFFHRMKKGTSPCIRSGHGKSSLPLRKPDKKSYISLEECEKLQGIPVGYTHGLSHTRRHQVIGNSWTVPVISHIFKGLKKGGKNAT